MIPWQLALWGAAGGLMVEAIEFYSAIKRTGTWPWKSPGETEPLPLLVSVVIRIGVGFGLAWAAAANNQVTGAFGAIAVGVAAPLLLEQMMKNVPVGPGPVRQRPARPPKISRESSDAS